MTDEKLRWLEAAYLYYLHPEFIEFEEFMSDAEWDALWRKNNWECSLHYMKEEDYPEEIRNKYK